MTRRSCHYSCPCNGGHATHGKGSARRERQAPVIRSPLLHSCTLVWKPSLAYPACFLLLRSHTDHHAHAHTHAQSLPLMSLPAHRCLSCHGGAACCLSLRLSLCPQLLIDDRLTLLSSYDHLTPLQHIHHNTAPCKQASMQSSLIAASS